MFQFPGLAPSRWHASCVPGCPIRKSADLGVFATPRGLSQLVTSFFASESLGIPRTLLLDFLVSSSIVKVFLPPSGVSAMGGNFVTFDSSWRGFLRAALFSYMSCLPNMSNISPRASPGLRTDGGLPRVCPIFERPAETALTCQRLFFFVRTPFRTPL